MRIGYRQRIVCISGTNRPDNYTSRALQIVINELRNSGVDPIVFDARTLSLAFPGHPDTGTASNSAPQLLRRQVSFSLRQNIMAAFVQ